MMDMVMLQWGKQRMSGMLIFPTNILHYSTPVLLSQSRIPHFPYKMMGATSSHHVLSHTVLDAWHFLLLPHFITLSHTHNPPVHKFCLVLCSVMVHMTFASRILSTVYNSSWFIYLSSLPETNKGPNPVSF